MFCAVWRWYYLIGFPEMRWGSTRADCVGKDEVDVEAPSCALSRSSFRLPAILNRFPRFLVRWDP